MLLRCDNLSVSFVTNGHSVPALSDVSFETSPGEFVSVIGPSGCGKTTLLRALAGLQRPSSGTLDIAESGRLILVFQEEGLFPWMNVLDNAAFGLAGRERSYPHQLSVGMKQRVAVIRSFLSDPSILLMDEPFGALDAQTRLELQQELLSLWSQSRANVVFVTHDVDEAILLSDRILVLSAQPGSIVGEYHVGFGRPRSAAFTLSEEFLVLKGQLLTKLGLAQPLGVPVL